jgi:chromate reductase
MKILVFAGSNSTQSINLQFAKYASTFFNGEVEVLKISDFETPIYSPEREDMDGVPDLINQFANKISSCDLIILSLAEHNGSFSSGFKNLYDWISRIPNRKVFDGRPLFLLSTSPGARAGAGVMATALQRFARDGAEIVGDYSLPSFGDNFDMKHNKITNDTLLSDFHKVVDAVKGIVKK